MKRKILALIFTICLCISFTPSIYALDTIGNAESLEEEYMASTIFTYSGVTVYPTDSYLLLDISGNYTFVCVEFTTENSTAGFGIIDLTNYRVTMYALDADVPFSSRDTVVCDGTLNFALVNEEDNTAKILGTETEIALDELYNDSRSTLTVTSAEERVEITNNFSAEIASIQQTRSTEEVLVDGGDDLDLVFKAGSNSGGWDTDCGINAVAMYLYHMYMYFEDDYVNEYHTNEETLKCALAAISNDLFGITEAISMSRLEELTNEYIYLCGGSNAEDVTYTTYSWTKYRNQINNGNGYPCILYIPANETNYWDSAHAVLGVGYTSGTTSSSGYAIVNSGWSSLGYVNIDITAPSYMIK